MSGHDADVAGGRIGRVRQRHARALQGLQRDHRGHHIGRHTGPAPTQKMTRYRLRIEQFPLTIRSTLHTNIIANNQHQQANRHAGLFTSFLVSCARSELY